ncbi:hypothetical protein AB0N17_42660 [Streptomyces sp. NPDC051133]|uniref:hypothetical protein n=1 Tax=Streptomyces sp. NPDC051133 TaxID=3155521 RepID=UPI0034132CF9
MPATEQAMHALADEPQVPGDWQADEIAETEGRPGRRFYSLTDKGAEQAPHALS